MSTRTIFLARLIGLYSLVEGLSLPMHKQAALEVLKELSHDAPLLCIASLIAVGIGLAMVLTHNVWSGGALLIVVTLVGWIALIKGLLLLILPQQPTLGYYLGTLQYEQFFYVYAAIPLILGIYLTYGGFKAKAR